MLTGSRIAACAVLMAASLASPLAGAAEAQDANVNHGYFGVGLLLASSNIQTPAGDSNSAGGGLIFNGAGKFGVGSNVGIGVTGELDFGSRTVEDTDTAIAEVRLNFDGGVILADIFYLSLGMDIFNQTPDDSDITGTYFVVPLGLGILHTRDEGYGLVQLRFGGGQLSNDYDSSTEDVGFFGIRLAGQMGTADGLQFMGGMEFDSYGWDSVDVTDSYFRLFFGAGFGG